MPALPLDEAGKYVAGAYVVFLALLLIYVAIMASRLSRIDRELGELAELAERNKRGTGPSAPDQHVGRAQTTDPHPDGADAGAEADARGVAERNMFEARAEQPSGGVPGG